MSQNQTSQDQLPTAPRVRSGNPSLKQLVAQTVADGKRLLKAQVNLTTTEIAQTGKTIGTISVFALIALTLISLGGLFILIAAAYGLVAAGLPVWAGFLIVAVVLVIGGLIFGAVARQKGQKMKTPGLAAQEWKQTADTLAQLNDRKSF